MDYMENTDNKNKTDKKKITCYFHSGDFDGLFCREIARKFLPDAELIGWNFGDAPQPIPEGQIYVMDLPVDRLFGFDWGPIMANMPGAPSVGDLVNRIVWIDHHASSIESHPTSIPGYRIDGVAACRLAWQWFQFNPDNFPRFDKQAFVERKVVEPWAVRLAGEYDIWDKRDDNAELFQHGLRSQPLGQNLWRWMFGTDCDPSMMTGSVEVLLKQGEVLQYSRANEYREVITLQGFTTKFEGVTFLACNSHRLDIRSQLFESGIKPEHEALLGFTFMGNQWSVSMYHIPGKEHVDILSIAKKYKGGGHAGANGMTMKTPTFLEQI